MNTLPPPDLSVIIHHANRPHVTAYESQVASLRRQLRTARLTLNIRQAARITERIAEAGAALADAQNATKRDVLARLS